MEPISSKRRRLLLDPNAISHFVPLVSVFICVLSLWKTVQPGRSKKKCFLLEANAISHFGPLVTVFICVLFLWKTVEPSRSKKKHLLLDPIEISYFVLLSQSELLPFLIEKLCSPAVLKRNACRLILMPTHISFH